MYTDFYGLKKKPFETTPDPDFFFLSRQHREILASLLYGLEFSKGVILIAGDIGTGKTTLINVLLQEVGENWLPITIINPKVSFEDVLCFVGKKLQINLERQNSLLERIDTLSQGLSELYTQGRRVVLIIDEAHLLDQDALEDIRLLSNIEEQGVKLMQIILVGQNEIFPLLNREKSRPLYQRMTIIRKLEPFTVKQTKEYIDHRIKAAGGNSDIFLSAAQHMIAKKSRGIPRVINQVCDNALLIGYALEKRHIGRKIIQEVLADMRPQGYSPQINLPRKILTAFAGGAIIFFLLGLVLFLSKDSSFLFRLWRGIPGHEGAKISSTLPQFASNLPDNETARVIGHSTTLKEEKDQTINAAKQILPAENDPEKIPQTITAQKLQGAEKVKIGINQWLYKLCRRRYGLTSELLVDLIHMANPSIKNVNLVYPNQKVFLPSLKRKDLLVKDKHGLFHIHYASFYRFKKAEAVLKELVNKGYKAFMIPNLQGENTVFRIYVGIFKNRNQGLQQLQHLELPFFISKQDPMSVTKGPAAPALQNTSQGSGMGIVGQE